MFSNEQGWKKAPRNRDVVEKPARAKNLPQAGKLKPSVSNIQFQQHFEPAQATPHTDRDRDYVAPLPPQEPEL